MESKVLVLLESNIINIQAIGIIAALTYTEQISEQKNWEKKLYINTLSLSHSLALSKINI